MKSGCSVVKNCSTCQHCVSHVDTYLQLYCNEDGTANDSLIQRYFSGLLWLMNDDDVVSVYHWQESHMVGSGLICDKYKPMK